MLQKWKIIASCVLLSCTAVSWAASSVAPQEPVQSAVEEADGTFVEGKHFLKVSDDVLENDLVQEFRKENQGKVQVLEFFSYGCGWCYKLDEPLEKWRGKVAKQVDFQRIPVEFQPSWRNLSKAYYVAEDLKQLQNIHHPLFKAIHSDELNSSSEEVLRAFFQEQGITPENFDNAFDSFSVNRKHKWANAISQAYKVTAVPALYVQGPEGIYYTSIRLAGGQDKVFEVADFLIAKQKEALSSNNMPQSLSQQSTQNVVSQ